jgi:hypothetical protein
MEERKQSSYIEKKFLAKSVTFESTTPTKRQNVRVLV